MAKPEVEKSVTVSKTVTVTPPAPKKRYVDWAELVERFKFKLEEIAPALNLPTKARDGGLLDLLKEAAESEFENMSQVCVELRNLHMVDVIEPDQSKAKNSAEIKNGSSTQSVNQKARFDVAPVLPGGTEATGGDPTVNGPTFKKEDGTSPIIEYKWTVDGKEASNSAQMDDPFHLGSYEDNGGCTPTLKLVTPVGEGRHQVQMYAFIRPEYNGGVGVQSNTITWYCD